MQIADFRRVPRGLTLRHSVAIVMRELGFMERGYAERLAAGICLAVLGLPLTVLVARTSGLTLCLVLCFPVFLGMPILLPALFSGRRFRGPDGFEVRIDSRVRDGGVRLLASPGDPSAERALKMPVATWSRGRWCWGSARPAFAEEIVELVDCLHTAGGGPSLSLAQDGGEDPRVVRLRMRAAVASGFARRGLDLLCHPPGTAWGLSLLCVCVGVVLLLPAILLLIHLLGSPGGWFVLPFALAWGAYSSSGLSLRGPGLPRRSRLGLVFGPLQRITDWAVGGIYSFEIRRGREKYREEIAASDVMDEQGRIHSPSVVDAAVDRLLAHLVVEHAAAVGTG